MNEQTIPQRESAGDVPEVWASVEIFGHRRHFGRVTEVEKFGTKMLRIDVPAEGDDAFDTFFYGGSAIFSLTLMSEEAVRKWAARERPVPVRLLDRRPPDDDDAWGPADAE